MKEKLANLTTLTLYNPAHIIKLSADASSYGVGAVLLQENDGKWQPIAYASPVPCLIWRNGVRR